MKISSPVGEYEYQVERVAFRSGRIEILGRLGQWETTAILDKSDLRALLRKSVVPIMFGAGLVAVTRGLKRV